LKPRPRENDLQRQAPVADAAATPETWDWSRPIYDHVQLHVRDLRASVRFYETVLAPLGIPLFYATDDVAEFPNLGLVAGRPPSGPMHLAFRAATEDDVHAFHAAGVSSGFRDNGAPGVRPQYYRYYYAAYLLDPDDNNVEAVFRDVTRDA
jgi:catechol 2,3-dioxygenase-like lactoylglutathione lyase family enzyme